jgi:tRNA(Ile)-lysidine synthase
VIRIVQTYIETHRLLTFGKPVIVGFSGGSDSVSLLYMLNRLGYTCIAAHCNFRLRRDESDRDEAFCKQFAEKYRIDSEINRFDTIAYAKRKRLSIEMAARKLRYEWFETIRKKHDAQAIAVAHHQDDSHETILLNLIRGTGIRGLCGIRPKNGWIVRPLRCLSAENITSFLKTHNLPFVTDSTNLTDAYTRNFIRLRLLPLMEKINPSVKTALARAADHLSDTEAIYLQTIKQLRHTLVRPTNKDEFRISIEDLMQQPARQTVLYELLQPFGFARPVTEEIFRALTGIPGKRFRTPDGEYELLKDRDFLFIYKSSAFVPNPQKTTELQNRPETYSIDEQMRDESPSIPIRFSTRKVKIDASFKIDTSPLVATFDYDKLQFPLTLRKWKAGDRFIPFGMKQSKKLSDFFSDEKYNRLNKRRSWLLCSGDRIIWVVGKRIDNRFRIDNQTRYAFIINFFDKTYD